MRRRTKSIYSGISNPFKSCDKVSYRSVFEAKSSAWDQKIRARIRPNEWLYYYYCNKCNAYHLTKDSHSSDIRKLIKIESKHLDNVISRRRI